VCFIHFYYEEIWYIYGTHINDTTLKFFGKMGIAVTFVNLVFFFAVKFDVI